MFVPRAIVCQPQIYTIAGLVLDAENRAEKMKRIAVAETGVEHRIISSGTQLETAIGVSNGKKMQEREEAQSQAEPVGQNGEFWLYSKCSVKGSLSLWLLFGECTGRGKNGNRPAERWTE